MVAAEEPQLEVHMDVVRRIASSLRRRLPPGRAELEELEADGFEALVRALRVYDSSKGPLIPYIVLRCRGAMIDGLRRKTLRSRSDQARGVEGPLLLSLEHELCKGLRIGDLLADPHAATAEDVIERVSTTNLGPELAALSRRCRRIAVARFV